MLGKPSRFVPSFITASVLGGAVLIGATGSAPVASAVSATALSPIVTANCRCTLSVDGLGSTDPVGGPIKVQKNAGATVRQALLFAASTGGGTYTPVDGDVTLNGNAVTWNAAETVSNNINSVNVESDVTAIVKPIVDAAPAGLVSLTVAEPNHTFDIDGEILAVIFDDPTAPANNSIILMYGAQSNAGDSFNANLANPVDLTNASFTATMGIGDSFGFQPANQFSTIAINGTQITSSAGGQDDCVVKYDAAPDFSACQDGALITVGGLGDSAANPPDPNADDSTCGSPAAPRCDDELYDLKPFLNNGDTSIQVDTLNASNNDNIFFAALDLTATSAIVGEGVLLSPDTATNPVGASHTVTATVSDANGSPVANQLVSFNVVSGPNSGVNGSASTNASGQATFTYSSAVAGTDTIQASFTNANTQTFTSNQVTKTWTSATNAGGAFVIGDGSAGAPTVGRNVNFWGAQWAKSNTFTGGGAPAAMKGFADRVQSLTCGSTFVTRPGNSANPPARLPSSIQVIVTSKVTKSGSSITGNIAHIVNVQVNPGYGPNPGHRGTGTITGVVC